MKKEKQKARLPAWVFVLTSLLWQTLLFQLMIGSGFHVGRVACIAAFGAAFGLLHAWICSMIRSEKWSFFAAWLAVGFWCVFYLTEFFISDAFRTFMTPLSIFSAAGDVMNDFSSTILRIILTQGWRVLLFLAVPVAMFLLRRRIGLGEKRKKVRLGTFLAFVGSLLLALQLSFSVSPDQKALWTSYDYDSAVRGFDLPAATVADLIHSAARTEETSQMVDPSLPAMLYQDLPELETGTQPSPTNETILPTDSAAPPETQAATEPETTVETEPPVTYNELDFDFNTLEEEAESEQIKTLHHYVASQKPSRKNEYTGLFEGKNLILITAESFSLETVDEVRTPTLYRLLTKGIRFTDYYQPAWGGSTSTGEFSIMTGLAPTDGVHSVLATIGHDMHLTLGNQLMAQGYFSRAYHNNSYTYYNRDKTHENLGYEKFIGMGNGMEEGVENVWPASDREMIDFTLKEYLDRQPFSVYYMTVSGHGMYSRGGNYMSNKNYDALDGFEGSETIRCYHAANLELEYALQDLVAALEEAGIADDTVIVLGADHYPYCLEKSVTWDNRTDCLSELYGAPAKDCFDRDHSALIVWSGCIEDMGLQVDTPVYSLDIVPTLSNLFGLPYDSRLLVGRDVFSDQTPLVLWPNHSWITDLGRYNASSGTFTPTEGVTVPEGYVDAVSTIVSNKLKFSDTVIRRDYYRLLFEQ